MTVVSAFLVPGSPLPYFKADNPPWRSIAEGLKAAGRSLHASRPDVILAYSTQWIAVLDELWQTRPHLQGKHVDENWYEYGDLKFDIRTDVKLAEACVAGSKEIGVNAKAVDYDSFPIDTGTIVMSAYLNGDGKRPVVIASNNLYHDGATTEKLGAMAAAKAKAQGKRVAMVGIGLLSGSIFRQEIDVAKDRVADPAEDAWNKRILGLLERGDVAGVRGAAGDYAKQAKVDMGFKHMFWLLGGLGGSFSSAKVHAYGPVYGNGAAVVELRPN